VDRSFFWAVPLVDAPRIAEEAEKEGSMSIEERGRDIDGRPLRRPTARKVCRLSRDAQLRIRALHELGNDETRTRESKALLWGLSA
jgi:hypothetical protein